MYPRVQGVITRQGNDIGRLINMAADVNNCPPRDLTALLIAESNLDETAYRDGPWPDKSTGLGQQTLLYAVVGDHTGSAANVALVRAYYEVPANAIREAAKQYGAYYRQTGTYTASVAKYNGGPAATWQSIPAGNQANYQVGWEQAAQYEVTDVAIWTYRADTPPVLQSDPWSCSCASTAWLLRSLGLPAAYPALEGPMRGAGLVSPDLGLLDGSGGALAIWLRRAYGLGGIEQHSGVSWDWLQSHAGQGPIIMGGAGVYHWVGVCGSDGDQLLLANPAPGYKMLGQTMAADQFNAFGPWSALWVPVAPEEDPEMIAELQQELADLRAKYDELNNYSSSLGHDTLAPTVAELHAAAANPKAKRADLQATLERVALRLTPYVVE